MRGGYLMKQIRKIIIVILSFSMLFRTANIAYATTVEQSASNNLLDKSRIESLKQYAEDFIAENNSNEQIISTYELYNLNDEVVAMLYNLSTGYIIVNIKDFSIPEFSFESNSCYSNDNSKKYYNGGLEYYEERTSGSLVDLYDEPTGYSYKEYSSGTQYLIINDGHGRTGVYMDITQSDFIIG